MNPRPPAMSCITSFFGFPQSEQLGSSAIRGSRFDRLIENRRLQLSNLKTGHGKTQKGPLIFRLSEMRQHPGVDSKAAGQGALGSCGAHYLAQDANDGVPDVVRTRTANRNQR